MGLQSSQKKKTGTHWLAKVKEKPKNYEIKGTDLQNNSESINFKKVTKA
jgi:hypothetical protein